LAFSHIALQTNKRRKSVGQRIINSLQTEI